jgi:hypothetical protein
MEPLMREAAAKTVSASQGHPERFVFQEKRQTASAE